MSIYVATFHGDISDHAPIARGTLEDVLWDMREQHGYGERSDYGHWITPDPEDDKIEIWEFDENGRAAVVWGFWGWHWQMPDGMEQGRLPLSADRSLYDLAMEEE